MTEVFGKVSKAVAAALSAGVAAYGVAVQDGSVGGDELVTLLLAVAGAFVVTYWFPKNTT
jgi:hypothetical protein